MLRSAVAVLAGLFLTMALVVAGSFLAARYFGLGPGDPPTPGYLAANLAGSAVAGFIGGATAMRLAPHRPHGHVGALAIVILLLSLPTLLSAPASGQPAWYGLAISVIGPVSVVIGGVLAAHIARPGRR